MKENSSGSLKWTGGRNPFVLVDDDDIDGAADDEVADANGVAGKDPPPSSPLLLVDEPRKRWALCRR